MNKLTEQIFWDDYWNKKNLPLEIKREDKNLFLNEILNTIDRHLPKDERLSVIEIGGSPGQYLAYLYKKFGYDIHCLDYSKIGCELTAENFKMLNIPGKIYQNDILSEDLHLPFFDIVYSLGFIEHFTDLSRVIQKHLNLLKPGGTLLIGVPNFLGINYWFLKRLAPNFLAKHNLDIMKISEWKMFEEKFHLKTIFKGYIGGLEPGTFNRIEKRMLSHRLVKIAIHILTHLLRRHFKIIRKLNSRWISGYAMGIYRKPDQETAPQV